MKLQEKKGQALVEFAIILPIVLLLVMGILEFGLIMNSYLSIEHASREGARAGSVGGSDVDIQNAVNSVLTDHDLNRLTIQTLPSESNRTRGEALTVRLLYDYHVTVPIISAILNNTIELEAETTMRIE